MKFDKKTQKILIMGLVVVALLAFASKLIPLEVLSVDRIWLHQRGVGEAGEELKGGFWRVTATSSDTKIQFLQLNEGVMKANQEYSGDFPSDVDVNGEIYVTVSQPYNPYWVIPINDLGSVEVVPSMQGVHLDNGPSGDIKADSVTVHLWSLNLAQKKVIIPFEVTAGKMVGENTGWLKTDDPRAKQITNPNNYVTYSFEISQSDIVDGETSNIVFYNPNDPEEKFKINLLWAFGDYDKYSWNENLLFVTPEVTQFSPSQEVTFLASNEQAIRQQLDWRSGNVWAFCRYWYGGGNIFKGTASYKQVQPPFATVSVGGKIIESNGKSTALIGELPYHTDSEFLTEGFVSGTTEQIDIFEYAGWYTPHQNAIEMASQTQPSDWRNWRYPLTPNIFADTASTPTGKGIVNYLASSVEAPVSGYTHSPFPRRNPDVWGYGVGGHIGVNAYLGVVLPTAARKWLFTLDVSTELADTVVVKEDYIDVKITQPLSFNRYTLSAQETATGTVKLRNNSPYSGVVSVGIKAPDNLKYTSEISGGDGNLPFAAGEEKIITFYIKNTGLLDKEQSGTFRLSVTNQQPRETASQTFTMTFKPGIGIPDTQLSVTVKDAETGIKIGGIALTAKYGINNEYTRTATTSNGEAVMNLGKYTGSVTLVAVDYQGRYKSAEKVVQVEAGNNPVTISLIPKDSIIDPNDWTWILVGLALSVTAVMIYYVWRKKR